MNLPIVDFETAKDLKELDFDWRVECAYLYDGGKLFGNKEECVAYLYNQNHNGKEHRFSAPTQAEVCKWLRYKYECDVFVDEEWIGSDEQYYSFNILYRPKALQNKKREIERIKRVASYRESPGGTYMGAWRAYEEAELEGIKKAIEILKAK